MRSRFLLLDEIQACIWRSPAEMPEIDIQMATVIENHASYDDAISAAARVLGVIGGEMIVACVRPIEECARCHQDFNTNAHHHTLTVTEEIGEETAPEIINLWYVARFCQECGDVFKGRI